MAEKAHEVAAAFCGLGCNGQAEFFNAISEKLDTWGGEFRYRMQLVLDSCKLDAGGIDVMRTIGEYGQAALPDKDDVLAQIRGAVERKEGI